VGRGLNYCRKFKFRPRDKGGKKKREPKVRFRHAVTVSRGVKQKTTGLPKGTKKKTIQGGNHERNFASMGTCSAGGTGSDKFTKSKGPHRKISFAKGPSRRRAKVLAARGESLPIGPKIRWEVTIAT